MKRLIILLILVQIAFATTIEQAETTADMQEQSTAITIDYIMVSDSEENLVFRLPSDVKKLTIKADSEVRECTVELQEKENKQEFYVNPEPSAVLSDGQRIIIEWEAAQATRFSGTAIMQALNTGSGPATLVGVIVTTFVLTLIIVLGIQFIKDNRKTEKAEQHETKEILPTFIESEQIVVDMLKKSDDNSLWQKHIEKE